MTEIAGRLETIAGHVVEGWAFNPADETRPVIIEIRDGGRLLGSTSTSTASRTSANGQRFSYLLPPDVFDGHEHVISVRVAGAEADLQDSPLCVVGHEPDLRPAAAGAALEIPSGSLDLVTDEGWVLGWAWYPNSPGQRVEIELLVDGELVGATIAASYRADVADAGVGDGNYGFSWALPYQILTRSRESVVTARDKKTGHVLPEPRKFQQLVVADAVEKVAALEQDLKQLTATIALLRGREQADHRDAAELFKTVGDFFIQLAAATAAGEPPGTLTTLRDAVADVTARHRPFGFDVPLTPILTICVEAAAPLPATYRQLRAIRDSIGGLPVEVILLDTGAAVDTALLPLVVRNIRYLRLPPDRAPVAMLNEVALLATCNILVFVGALAAPAESWLDAVTAGFAEDADCAALAAKFIGADNVLEHAGVMLEDALPVPRGHRCDPYAEPYLDPQPVDAVAPEVFAVRREAWIKLRGLDESFAGLGAALADFCLRLRAGGAGVLYVPGFCMTQAGAAHDQLAEADDAARLRHAADLQTAAA